MHRPTITNRPSVLRDISNYLSARVFLVALGFASFPLMTRMLTVSEYGVVSLTLRIILLLTVLSKCGLQYSAARFYEESTATGQAEAQRSFYSTLILGPLLTAVAVLGLFVPLLLVSHRWINDPLLYRCLLLAPVLVLLRTVQSLLLSLLRNEGRSRLHSILEVSTRLLTLAAMITLFVGSFQSAFNILAATSVSEFAIVLLQLILLIRRDLIVPSSLDWSLIRTSLIFGAPLIAYELSSIVLDSGDRLLVRHFLGDRPLGLYSAAYNVSGYLQDTLMTPLNLAIFPIYMRLWKSEGKVATQQFLSTALSWFTVAAFALTALAILCSKDAITLLASTRFVEAHSLLPILVPGLMLYGSHIFLNVGLILEKRTALLAMLVCSSAMINLALNLFFIPSFGIAGAAWATLLSYGLLIATLAWINQRILPLQPDFSLIGKAAAAAGIATVLPALIHTGSPALTLALRIPLNLFVFTLLFLLFSKQARSEASKIIQRFWPKAALRLHLLASPSASFTVASGLEAMDRGQP